MGNNNFDLSLLENRIIAHRGESHLAPENTLESINLAWQNGVKAVEIDVHLTKDNHVVVIHDYDTLRTGGIKKVIKETLLKELKELNVGSFKGDNWGNVKIPTLEEALNTVPDDSRLIIEIKGEKETVFYIKELLNNYPDTNVEIIAFDYETIKLAKKEMPYLKALWLLDLDYYGSDDGTKVEGVIKELENANLDGADLFAGKMADNKFVSTLLQHDFLVYFWTINGIDIAKYFLEMNASGITTDRASWLTKELNTQ